MTETSHDKAWEGLSELLREDPVGRGVAALSYRSPLKAACKELRDAEHAALCTGFVHLGARKPETDGPPGALALGRGLDTLGIQVTYVTDGLCQEALESIEALPTCVPLLRGLSLARQKARIAQTHLFLRATHLVSVERAGRTADGSYRNIKGEDITPLTGPIDELFLTAAQHDVVTLGIGDGGNEIGMGRLAEEDPEGLAGLTGWPSEVGADYLLVAGTGNRGCYALLAGLSLLEEQDLLPTADQMEADLENLLEAGAVDGITGEATMTVDTRPLAEEQDFVARCRALLP